MEVKSDIMKVQEESLVDKEYLLEKFGTLHNIV